MVSFVRWIRGYKLRQVRRNIRGRDYCGVRNLAWYTGGHARGLHPMPAIAPLCDCPATRLCTVWRLNGERPVVCDVGIPPVPVSGDL